MVIFCAIIFWQKKIGQRACRQAIKNCLHMHCFFAFSLAHRVPSGSQPHDFSVFMLKNFGYCNFVTSLDSSLVTNLFSSGILDFDCFHR